MEWNLDIKSFKRIYNYEQRKGSNIDKLFQNETIEAFISLLSPASELKDPNPITRKKCFDEFRGCVRKIEGDEEWIENITKLLNQDNFGKKELRKIRRFLSKWKEAYIESLMEEFTDTKELKIRKGEIIKGKQVYCIENNIRNFIVSRVLQQKIKQVYQLTTSNRNLIAAQLRNILADRYPKIVVKADVQSFYESIDFDGVIKKMESDHMMSSQFISLLKNIKYQYGEYSGKDKGIPRGIGVSAFIAEYEMRKFDNQVKAMDGLLYYARFVDDVIAIFSAGSSNTKDEIYQIGKDAIYGIEKAISAVKLSIHNDQNDPKKISFQIFPPAIESDLHINGNMVERHASSLLNKIANIQNQKNVINEKQMKEIKDNISSTIDGLEQISKGEFGEFANKAQKILLKERKLLKNYERFCNCITNIDCDSKDKDNIATECLLKRKLKDLSAYAGIIQAEIRSMNEKIPFSFSKVEFLGYKYIYYSMSESQKKGSLAIDIADSKIEKQKRKIDAAFKCYFLERKSAEKADRRKSSRLLFYRIRFLTDSYYLVGFKKNIIAGLPSSYPLVSDECKGFDILNQYLHDIAKKSGLPEWLQDNICKLEFRKWDKDTAVPVRVNKNSFTDIMKCWREE